MNGCVAACVLLAANALSAVALDNGGAVYPLGWTKARSNAATVANIPGCSYVDGHSGDDHNSGDAQHPWRTIQKAADTMSAGQMVRIHGGTYPEVVRLKRSGAPRKPIIFAACTGEEVVIDGEGKRPGPRWDGLIVADHVSYVEVVGLHLVNSTFAGLLAEHCDHLSVRAMKTDYTWSSGLQFWNCTHLDVIGNDVRRACQGKSMIGEGTQECLTLGSCADFEVAYNDVRDRPVDLGGGGEGIDAKEACLRGKIDHNLVENLVRLGIYIDGYGSNLRDVEVTSNVVRDCESGVVVSAEQKAGTVTNVRITDNLAFHNRENGIVVSDYVGDGVRREILIANNTVANNGHKDWGGGIYLATRNPGSGGFTVTNNVLSQNGAWQLALRQGMAVTASGNLIDGFRGYHGGAGGEEEIQGADATESEPHFIDAKAYDFRRTTSAQASSPVGANCPVPSPVGN